MAPMDTKVPQEGAPITSDWPQLVARIRRGDPSAMEEMYQTFPPGIRMRLLRIAIGLWAVAAGLPAATIDVSSPNTPLLQSGIR